MVVLACVRGVLACVRGTQHGNGSCARVSCNNVVCLIQQCRKSKRSLSYACVTGEWQSCYVSFHECVRTSKIYVRECTPVPPLAMLLFCKSTYRPRLVPPAQNVCRHACASCAFLSRLAVMSAVPTFERCAYLCGATMPPSVVFRFQSPCLHPLVIRSLTARSSPRRCGIWRHGVAHVQVEVRSR